MASSSSLHAFSAFEPPGKRRKVDESSRLFDVFINHRGPDVKQTLATQLYNSLHELGIKAFLDSEEKELGDSFPSTIQTAIRSAAVHVAIFSKNYAHSPWCLAELVLMFSHCKTIVSAVEKEFRRRKNLHVAEYPVGLHKLVEEFERRCLNELVKDFDSHCAIREEVKDKAKIVGIFGMGGVGKTTLSKELFNRKKSEYTRTCFLFDVREASARSGLTSLQMKILNDLFNRKPPNFQSAEEGTSYLKDCLGRNSSLKFLIFLDDIDHVEQLDALLVKDMLNQCADSLIIITTRDVGVLISAGINVGYQLKGMDGNDGRELFCWHAFGQPHPASGYDHLVEDFVDVCGGLPLSLQVLGRHVHGRPQNYWLSEFNKVTKILPRDIKKKLKISFDALETEEKQIFIDIACFFVEKDKSIAVRVWEGSGWHAQHALETLRDKCLVEEITYRSFSLDGQDSIKLRMHDHLRDLGREMTNALNHPHRLWRQQDLMSLELKGFQNILAQTKDRCFHSIFDESLSSRITYFVGQSDDSGKASACLLWLQLELDSCTRYPSIPSWIPLQNLQFLRICYGRLERLWQSNVQTPSQLKELQIYESFVEEVPDMLEISNKLENVVLDTEQMPIRGYSLSGSLRMNLSTFSSSIEWASVKSLSIQKFKSKGVLTLNNGVESRTVEAPMSGLENLEISGKTLVTKILISGNHCPRLESLKLHDMANLIEVDLSSVKSLNCLEVTNCISLQRISATFDLTNLVEFNISQCPEFKELCFGRVSCLGKFTIKNCLKRVAEISDLGKLVELNISGCRRLQELRLSHLSSLERITIVHCKELKSISGMSDLRKLVEYNISECCKLQEISFVHSSCLERITIEYCRILKTVSAMEGLEKLVTLNIRDCPELERLLVNLRRVSEISDLSKLIVLNISDCPELELKLSLVGMNCLESITVDGCGKLKSFELNGCKNLQSVSGMSGLEELAILKICKCPQLEYLPCLQGLSSLESITVDECGKLKSLELNGYKNLKRVSGMKGLEELAILQICECPELVHLPCLQDLSCLEMIRVDGCGKLKSVELNGCKHLKSVSGMSGLEELAILNICECPELEYLPCLQGLSSLESITVDECGKLKSLKLNGYKNLKRVSGMKGLEELAILQICECPELVHLPCLQDLSCLEMIRVDGCGKLKSVELNGCKHLKSVSGMSGLEELAILNICECPELEYLPCLQGLSSLESITVDECGKLKSLELNGYKNLKRVSGMKGLEELAILQICECPELVHLPCLQDLSCLEMIRVDGCGKLKSVELNGCKKLKRMSGMRGLDELVILNICECTELEYLACLQGLTCLKMVTIDGCRKLKSFELNGCINLKRVSGMNGLEELAILIICECPELEYLPCLQGLNCLKMITIDGCGKLNNLQWRICRSLKRVLGNFDPTGLSIFDCPELKELPCFAHVTRLEYIFIVRCGKLEKLNISECGELKELSVAHLSCLKEMTIENCQKLRRVSGVSDLSKLINLNISECRALELELSLVGMNFLKSIRVDGCGKLKSIELNGCKNLTSVSGMSGLEELEILNIRACPELKYLPWLRGLSCLKMIAISGCGKLNNLMLHRCENLNIVIGNPHMKRLIIEKCPELPSLARLSCLEYLDIHKCAKLQSISGILEMSALKDVQLSYCSNAVMRNCIDMLQSVPSEFMGVIGRAGNAAESTLNPRLFDGAIDADAVVEIDPRSEHPLEMMANELSAVIVCAVVVVDSSTDLDLMNMEMGEVDKIDERGDWFHTFYFENEGEWIITK
ncbi:hypothetical protein KI387_032938, partial [Taxus chinensis]